MMFKNNFRLSLLVLKRDFVRNLLWVIGIIALTVVVGNVLSGMYPSDTERLIMKETMKNPAMVAMMGPIFDNGNYTHGAMFSNMMLLWVAMLATVMNIFLVVRHTRQDEERGRIELIRSLPVGRLSTLSATLSVAFLLNFMIAMVTGLGLFALGVESMNFQGSMLFGTVIGVTGILFAAITAVFCQLCSNPRTALSLSFGFLGISYLVRAVGDMQNEILSCISPLGLILRTETYVSNNWWPVMIALALTAAATIFAFYLCSTRDMGEGIIPARPGRRNASPMLKSTSGLVLRLLRTQIIVWTAAIFILALAYGSIMGDLESFISSNELLSSIFTEDAAFSLTEQFVTFLMVIMSILGTIPVLSFMLKARSQERSGYAENLLTRAVSRNCLLMSYFQIAFAASIIMPFFNALGFWSASSVVMENPITLSTFLQASLAYVPAAWLMLGVAMVLIAYLPERTSLIWMYLGYSFFSVYIGTVVGLPDWTKKLTPFGYIPKIPTEEVNIVSIIVLVSISVALMTFGFIGYRKRDMNYS